ncbi:MAG: outer membrane protein transport protein [Gammaproteobacteria bacterium]|nr:outer membrane protein transport protein [Gammaproteobacteria bacterium]
MLWEATEHTRYGLVYTSEAQADLEGDLKFRNLGPVLESVLQQQGLLDSDIKVENTLPQRISGGMYHEFESGASFSIDAMWMEFSEFGTSSVSLNGSSLEIDENGAFDDFWGMSVGWVSPLAADCAGRSVPSTPRLRSMTTSAVSRWRSTACGAWVQASTSRGKAGVRSTSTPISSTTARRRWIPATAPIEAASLARPTIRTP